MPKQQLVVNRFEGGLNTDSDPRDIADNEFSLLKGYSVDSIGVIKTMGSYSAHSTVDSQSCIFKPGYGIFSFSSAYRATGALSSTKYLALSDASGVHIYSDIDDAWNGMVQVNNLNGLGMGDGSTVSTDNEINMYAPDGNLRACDGNFTNYINTPKKLGYIKAKTYGKGSSTTYPTTLAQVNVGKGASVDGTSQDGWNVNNASIETGVTSSNLKMINLGSVAKGAIETSSGDDDMATCTAHSDSSTPGVVTIANNDLDFGTLSGTDGYYNGMTCSVFNGSTAYYGVVVDYTNSGAGGAGTTGTFKIWAGPEGNTSFATLGASASSGGWGFQVGQSDGYLWNADFSHADHNQKQRDVISGDWGVTLSFEEGATGTGEWMTSTSTRYKFYHSTTFDGNQESHPAVFTMYPRKAASGETAHESVNEMYFANSGAVLNASSPTGGEVGVASLEVPVTFGLLIRMTSEHDPDGDGNFTIGSTSFDEEDQDAVDSTSNRGEYNFLGENQRVTGGHIWWASNEDGYKTLWLLAEYDLEKGARILGGKSTEGVGAFAPWQSWVYPTATNPVVRPSWTDGESELNGPPQFITYEALTGYSHDTKLNAKWKTSTIANGRAYIGNILRQEKSTFDGGGSWEASATPTKDIAKQGAIVGSPVGRYDTFPEDPNYEFTTSPGDGDEIIKLESFADRLICFYSNKFEVYNIEKGFENLELEIKNMGLDGGNPQQACLTDAGVAWINSYGVHFYNGQQVKTISDKIRNQWIGEDGYTAFWKSYANDVPCIAYDPKAQKLLICKTIENAGSGEEDILQFSLKTQSWTMKEDALPNNQDLRFTIYKGDLVFGDGTKIYTWNDTASNGTGSGGSGTDFIHEIYTKDIDFGSPSIRKKIYKVYITYRSEGPFTDNTCDYNNDPTIAHDDDNGAIKKGMNVTGTGIPSHSYVESVTSNTSFELNDSTTGGAVTNGTLTFNGTTNVQVKYGIDGDTTPTETFKDGANFTSNELDSVSGWKIAELKPTNSINEAKSFRLAFTSDGIVPAQFEINDITIIYRTKSIK
tara:strand:- start:21858 stop:24989 length:3132 start_codon:yes stop_codon:yes gene_type:complete